MVKRGILIKYYPLADTTRLFNYSEIEDEVKISAPHKASAIHWNMLEYRPNLQRCTAILVKDHTMS